MKEKTEENCVTFPSHTLQCTLISYNTNLEIKLSGFSLNRLRRLADVSVWSAFWMPFRVLFQPGQCTCLLISHHKHGVPSKMLVWNWNYTIVHHLSSITMASSDFCLFPELKWNKKAQLMLAYPRDAKTMKKIPLFRSYNKFQSSRKSGVYHSVAR